VGKTFRQWGRDGEIVGVVEDFHFASLRREVAPLSLAFYPTASRYITVRVATNDLPRILQAVEAGWSRLMPHRPFTYQFLDDAFQAQYRSEQQFGKLVGGFTLLALLVACLGLFGLASFTAQQRTKEIGVRKVLGASVPQIVLLLFGQFARLVAVAFVIALPVAYLMMGRWLDDFAYRIELTDQAGFFLLVALMVLSIAFLTVSFQSVRVALSDTVKALRYE
jgi:putative ABC transport system permease protein